jgi:hypothetical protein
MELLEQQDFQSLLLVQCGHSINYKEVIMKLILKTGEEFQVNSIFMLTDNKLSISFGNIESFDELKAKLTAATEEIKVYVTDDSYSVYKDFTTLVNPATVTQTADGTLDVVIILEKEDQLTKRVSLIETAFNEMILG